MTDIFNGMTNKYKLKKDLSDRLNSTICRYNGSPVIVNLTSESKFTLSDMITGNVVCDIDVDDPNFDISSPPLGYVNKPTDMSDGSYKVYYVVRLPMKRYHQGLNHRVVELYDIAGNSCPGNYINMYTKYVYDMLMDNYPSYDVMFENQTIKQMAISKDVALKRMDAGVILVFIKGKNVGWINPKERKILIPNGEFSWVTERYLNKYNLPFTQIG